MGKLNRSISLLKPTLRSFIAGLGFIALSGQADAAVLTANLNVVSDPNIGSGTLGIVTDSRGVAIDVALNSGINFVNTGGPHTPFTYNLNAIPTSITFVNPAIFSAAGTSGATPYGTYNHGVDTRLLRHWLPGLSTQESRPGSPRLSPERRCFLAVGRPSKGGLSTSSVGALRRTPASSWEYRMERDPRAKETG